jgi:hypothetical protein
MDYLPERFQQLARLTLVLEPVAHLLSGSVISYQVCRSKLGEVSAYGLHRTPRHFGQFARRQWSAVVQENQNLIDNWIPQQSAQPGFPVFALIHRSRLCQAPSRVNHTSTFREFSKRRNEAWMTAAEPALGEADQPFGNLHITNKTPRLRQRE